jgi:type II secretory pathway pseudopilin PulG
MSKSKLVNSEHGIAHLGLILVALVVIGVAGFAAYRVTSQNNKNDSVATNQQTAADEDSDMAYDDSSKALEKSIENSDKDVNAQSDASTNASEASNE